MITFIKGLLTGQDKNSRRKDGELPSTAEQEQEESEEDLTLDDDQEAERPYIINSIYYLTVILLIGVPVWFYTCSSTRYALPDLTQLESRLNSPGPPLHLDISVIQLAATSNQRDSDRERQSEYLRTSLPAHLQTSVQGLVYSLNWRIRRPTQEETQVMKYLLRDNDKPPTTDEQRLALYARLEENLLRVHKATNRFRLFMYVFDGPLSSLVCMKSDSYLINFERFIYICPGESDGSVSNLIKGALQEAYQETVDPKRVKKILGAKTDLLVSLIPETEKTNLSSLSLIADKVHKIHDKNVKSKYLELAGILNIRLITQNVYLLHENALDKMFVRQPVSKRPPSNATEGEPGREARVLNTKEMGRLFHDYESRLNKHSSQNVHHVVTLVPDQTRPAIVFDSKNQMPVQILEERDTNFILVIDEDKSMVLGMRAVVRRVIGLRSANLCKNCLVRRDVFLNKWELDAIVGALTILKLQSVLVSLRSVSQQAIGIKIPRYVSKMVHEAHSLTLASLDNLHTAQPLEAYHLISSAHELGETAYYDPSLLETLYFPDETKYAIYLPLFLPLGFPLALSLLRIGRYLLFSARPKNSSTGSRLKVKSN